MKKPTEKVIQFAAKRGISPKTLEDLKVEGGIAQYGNRSLESIVFGYYNLDGYFLDTSGCSVGDATAPVGTLNIQSIP